MRFSQRTTLSARKPASFWREKRDTVIILVRGFAKLLSCQNMSIPLSQFWHFSISKEVQSPAIRKTEQPILLTKSEIRRPVYKFSLKKTGSQISYSFSPSSQSQNRKVPNKGKFYPLPDDGAFRQPMEKLLEGTVHWRNRPCRTLNHYLLPPQLRHCVPGKET